MGHISKEEKLSRHRLVESAIGTSAMEGQAPDAATRALLDRFEQGELTLEQFSSAMDIHAQDLLARHGKMAGVA